MIIHGPVQNLRAHAEPRCRSVSQRPHLLPVVRIVQARRSRRHIAIPSAYCLPGGVALPLLLGARDDVLVELEALDVRGSRTPGIDPGFQRTEDLLLLLWWRVRERETALALGDDGVQPCLVRGAERGGQRIHLGLSAFNHLRARRCVADNVLQCAKRRADALLRPSDEGPALALQFILQSQLVVRVQKVVGLVGRQLPAGRAQLALANQPTHITLERLALVLVAHARKHVGVGHTLGLVEGLLQGLPHSGEVLAGRTVHEQVQLHVGVVLDAPKRRGHLGVVLVRDG